MDKPKKVCWNCNHCDTFGGVCLKGKFLNNPDKPISLAHYFCEEFDDNIFTQIQLENDRINKFNNELIEQKQELVNKVVELRKMVCDMDIPHLLEFIDEHVLIHYKI